MIRDIYIVRTRIEYSMRMLYAYIMYCCAGRLVPAACVRRVAKHIALVVDRQQ